MPAMPPTSAVPPLRTLRRVTVVMHSSLGVSELMPFGQSYAGLESPLSRRRGSTHANATTCAIRWLDHLQRRGGEFAAKQANSLQSSGALTSFPVVAAIPPVAWIVLRCSQRTNPNVITVPPAQ